MHFCTALIHKARLAHDKKPSSEDRPDTLSLQLPLRVEDESALVCCWTVFWKSICVIYTCLLVPGELVYCDGWELSRLEWLATERLIEISCGLRWYILYDCQALWTVHFPSPTLSPFFNWTCLVWYIRRPEQLVKELQYSEWLGVFWRASAAFLFPNKNPQRVGQTQAGIIKPPAHPHPPPLHYCWDDNEEGKALLGCCCGG